MEKSKTKTTLSNRYAGVCDTQLSFKARSILALLLSLPEGLALTPSKLVQLKDPKTGCYYLPQERGFGKTGMLSVFGELRAYGYAQIKFRYDIDSGQRVDSVWVIYAFPYPNTSNNLMQPCQKVNNEWVNVGEAHTSTESDDVEF